MWWLGAWVGLLGCSASQDANRKFAGKEAAGVSVLEVQRPAGPDGQRVIRVATFNTALSRPESGELAGALSRSWDDKAKLVAEVIQRVRPDVVLLQEFDYDASGQSVHDFMANYLAVSRNGAEPIAYEHFYMPEVNTGVPVLDKVGRPMDVDGDGEVGGPGDAHGWGNYPGHYGMVVLSRWPMREYAEWGRIAWPRADLAVPRERVVGHGVTVRPSDFRLSSKCHTAIKLFVETDSDGAWSPLMVVMAHPTPPVFDGPEDRNGFRNYDELTLLISIAEAMRGASPFVVMGDLNADPNDGESRPGAMRRVLETPALQDVEPGSVGGVRWSAEQGGVNASHQTDARLDTADWNDETGPGNLRVDYVLPSVDLEVVGSGVFWPGPGDRWVYLNEASDHRLVWVDVVLPAE